MRNKTILLALLNSVLVGCGDTSAPYIPEVDARLEADARPDARPALCVPGDSQACVTSCGEGWQVCSDDGSHYEPCACLGPDAGLPDATPPMPDATPSIDSALLCMAVDQCPSRVCGVGYFTCSYQPGDITGYCILNADTTSNGETCQQDGQPGVCTGMTCCTGCLDGAGVCRSGDTNPACGQAGAACVSCSATLQMCHPDSRTCY